MSRARATVTAGDQITTLLAGFTLTTAARELVSWFVEATCGSEALLDGVAFIGTNLRGRWRGLFKANRRVGGPLRRAA